MSTRARIVSIVLFAAALLPTITGCSSSGNSPTPASAAKAQAALPQTYPSTAIDWNHNDVDRVKFLKKFSLADYKKVVVEPVNTASCKLPDADDNSYQAVVDHLGTSTHNLTETLRAKLKGVIPVELASAPTTTPGKTLILRTRITEVDPGSRAARYAVSFGAGRAQTFLVGQIVDSSTNQPLIEFDNAKATGWGGFFGGSYEKVFHKEIVELGDSIGNLLLAFSQPAKK